MAAATAGRLTDSLSEKKLRRYAPQKASSVIYQGTIVMISATGYADTGATATGSVGAGVARNNTGLDRWTGGASDGDTNVEYEEGTFKFANSAAADQITKAEGGKVCYIVDNQTVAKTDGTGTRSPAGLVAFVDADGGVFVDFDIEKTRQATV